jgi:hypothetical protein
METLLGDRGRERRKQLKHAIELADQRALGDGSGEMIALPLTRISSAPGRPSGIPAVPDTPLASVMPPPREKRRLLPIALACVAAGTLLGGVVLGAMAVVRKRAAPVPIEIVPSSTAPAAPARTLAVGGQTTPTAVSAPGPVPPPVARGAGAPRPTAPASASASAAPPPSAEPSAAPPSPPSKGPVPVMDPGF